jgi:hypothetical protein
MVEGRRWAEWLHHGLENYQIPRSLRDRPNRSGSAVPKTLYPVFRDEEEMATARPLGALVDEGLRLSDWLIVLCSPRSAESPWVNSELERFQELGKGDRIIVVLIEGEPNAAFRNAMGEDVDPALECLPRALRRKLQTNATVAPLTAGERLLAFEEELAADFRPEGQPAQGYTSPGAYRLALEGENEQRPESDRWPRRRLRALEDQYSERLNLMRLKIIAGIIDVELAEVTKRDAEARARRARTLAISACVIAALLLALGLAVLNQSQRRRELLKTASTREHAQAQEFQREGDWQRAFAHIERALHYWPQNEDAAADLWFAQRHGPAATAFAVERAMTGIDDPHDLAFSKSGRWLAVLSSSDGIVVSELASGKWYRHWMGQTHWSAKPWIMEANGCVLISLQDPGWAIVPLGPGEVKVVHSLCGPPIAGAPFSSDGKWVICRENEGMITVASVETGRAERKLFSDAGLPGAPDAGGAWHPAGSELVVAVGNLSLRRFRWPEGAAIPAERQSGHEIIELEYAAGFPFLWVEEMEAADISKDSTGQPRTEARTREVTVEVYRQPLEPSGQTLKTQKRAAFPYFLGSADQVLWLFPDGNAALEKVSRVPEDSELEYLRFDRPKEAAANSNGRFFALSDVLGRVQLFSLETKLALTPLQALGRVIDPRHTSGGTNPAVLALQSITSEDRRVPSPNSLGLATLSKREVALWSRPPAIRPELVYDGGGTVLLPTAESPDKRWKLVFTRDLDLRMMRVTASDAMALALEIGQPVEARWTRDGHAFEAIFKERQVVKIPWDPPPAVEHGVEKIATLIGGQRFSENGLLEAIPLEERAQWRELARTWHGRDQKWRDLLDWWLSGRPTEGSGYIQPQKSW